MFDTATIFTDRQTDRQTDRDNSAIFSSSEFNIVWKAPKQIEIGSNCLGVLFMQKN